MPLNLEAEPSDPTQWTKLQTEICMKIARGKLDAFSSEAQRLAALVRVGLLTRTIAAEYLQEAAVYNALVYEYGLDLVQAIMADALESEAA